MLRTLLGAAVALVLLAPLPASATWSILAVDRATGRVAAATATCVNAEDGFLKGVQAVVLPGTGIALCQANVDTTGKNQTFIYNEMKKGTDPKVILEMLAKSEPAYQTRQFGIADMKGRMAGHTGVENAYVAQDMQGQVPGTEIFYSIQGNILRPGELVPNAVQAFIHTNGALTDRVMAAMEAADGSGGDSRCTCPPWPADGTKPPIPCNGRTSYISYILMADPKDAVGNGDPTKVINFYNVGNYSLYLSVVTPGENRGINQIKVGEDLNPVKTLRMRYDAWRKNQPASYK
jgi:hypothetical protein